MEKTINDQAICATLINKTAIVENLILSHKITEQNTLRAIFWWACRRGNLELVHFVLKYARECNDHVKVKIDLQIEYGIKNAEISCQDHVVQFLKNLK